MITRIQLALAGALTVLLVFAVPAGAQTPGAVPDASPPAARDELAPPPPARDQRAAPPAAASPGAPAAKGQPGMMGLPWPKTPDEAEKTLEALYAHLATESDKRRGGEIGAAIERLWRLEGGDTVNLLIDRGESFSAKNETERGMKFLDAAVDLAPDYAEAWSHRAYLNYRMQNYQAALGDLRRALALEPNHFRALDGMAKILDLIGEKKAALTAYDQLLTIHPNIEGAKEAADVLRPAVEGRGI